MKRALLFYSLLTAGPAAAQSASTEAAILLHDLKLKLVRFEVRRPFWGVNTIVMRTRERPAATLKHVAAVLQAAGMQLSAPDTAAGRLSARYRIADAYASTEYTYYLSTTRRLGGSTVRLTGILAQDGFRAIGDERFSMSWTPAPTSMRSCFLVLNQALQAYPGKRIRYQYKKPAW